MNYIGTDLWELFHLCCNVQMRKGKETERKGERKKKGRKERKKQLIIEQHWNILSYCGLLFHYENYSERDLMIQKILMMC